MSRIPKDHKGLSACEPFNHGVQVFLSSEEAEEEVQPSNKEIKIALNANFGKTALGYWNGKFHFK